jgi:5-formyltetrahydrofolate cyclo-ligase
MPDLPDKSAVRAEVLGARRARPATERDADDARLVRHAVALAAAAHRVAAYAPLPFEPGGPALLPALSEVVSDLLLPLVLPDRDLDWARYDGSLAPGGALLGVAEPTGPRLGPTAIAGADLVLVPAVAVSVTGVRLGRGGGSYDRALARVSPGTPVVALLYEDELRSELPAAAHDQPVNAVLTPLGFRPLTARRMA